MTPEQFQQLIQAIEGVKTQIMMSTIGLILAITASFIFVALVSKPPR